VADAKQQLEQLKNAGARTPSETIEAQPGK
jgi:hypothetical protein